MEGELAGFPVRRGSVATSDFVNSVCFDDVTVSVNVNVNLNHFSDLSVSSQSSQQPILNVLHTDAHNFHTDTATHSSEDIHVPIVSSQDSLSAESDISEVENSDIIHDNTHINSSHEPANSNTNITDLIINNVTCLYTNAISCVINLMS
ncbi:MAG: hypothetical protein ABW185_03410 [Sedimenticola sp.]